MNGPYLLKFDSFKIFLTPFVSTCKSSKYKTRKMVIRLIKYQDYKSSLIKQFKIKHSTRNIFIWDETWIICFSIYFMMISLYQKYSIMTQSSKTSFSVKQLITLLQNPRTRTTSKRREILLDRDQIKKKMTLKWKDPGNCNIQFTKSSSMRAQILNQWELQRISLAQRSYITPKESKPYQFDRESRQFPRVTVKAYPKKFQRYLKQVQLQKQDLLFKEKRTVTQGRSFQSTLSKENTDHIQIFKPASTSTKIFGFSSTKPYMSKAKNKHFQTLNL